ncbi:MAG: shikimate kinase AroK [Gammaproteobacteria bacterium]|nr:shikimate kinase AroK [Gammaproteobacteria bacterium]
MTSNVYLIGPMAVGKTTIGKQLARRLQLEFVDSDQEIEKRTGASISLIFDIEGESGFRDREEQMIAELTTMEGIVLATGGGVVLREANRKALRKNGMVIYLRASIDSQLERTRSSRHRPLLETGDRRAALESLMDTRDPLYRQEADIIIDTDNLSAGRAARQISRKIQNHKTCIP